MNYQFSRKKQLISLAIILIALFGIWQLVKVGEETKVRADNVITQDEISILTQNCYLPRILDKWQRLNILNKKIIKENQTIVFLQEALLSSEANTFKNDYQVYYKRGRLGPRGGLVILAKQKTSDISFYKFKNQGSIFSKQITDRIIEKGVLVVRFNDAILIDTHLVSIYNDKNNDETKNNFEQFKQLKAIIEEEAKTGKTIILAGDFNFNNESKPYQELIKLLNDQTISLKETAYANNQAEQIDFIFTNNEKSSKALINNYETFVSDHYGIVANIIFNREKLR